MSKLRIQLEVTTRCNHKCSYCPRRILVPETRSLGDITPEMSDLLVSRISEIDKSHDLMVSISGLGEPTLYHNLMEIIRKIKSARNPVIRLNTNASFLHKVGSDIISSNCVDRIAVCPNLPTKELYEKHTGSTDFTTVYRNIAEFLKEKGTRKPVTEIYVIKMPESMPHLEENAEHWKNHLNRNDMVSTAELSNWIGLVGEPQVPRTTLCRFQKDLLGKRLTINKEGYAGVCGFSIAVNKTHPLIVGNIKEHSIEELFKLAGVRATQLIGSRVCEKCNTDVVRKKPTRLLK